MQRTRVLATGQCHHHTALSGDRALGRGLAAVTVKTHLVACELRCLRCAYGYDACERCVRSTRLGSSLPQLAVLGGATEPPSPLLRACRSMQVAGAARPRACPQPVRGRRAGRPLGCLGSAPQQLSLQPAVQAGSPAFDAHAALAGRFHVPAPEVQAWLQQAGCSMDQLLLQLTHPASRLARPPISNFHVGWVRGAAPPAAGRRGTQCCTLTAPAARSGPPPAPRATRPGSSPRLWLRRRAGWVHGPSSLPGPPAGLWAWRATGRCMWA